MSSKTSVLQQAESLASSSSQHYEQCFILEQKFLQLIQQPGQYAEAKKFLDTTAQQQPKFSETNNFKGMQLAYTAYGIQHGFLDAKNYEGQKSVAIKESIKTYTTAIEKYDSLSAAYLCGLLCWDEYLLSHNKKEMYPKVIECFTHASKYGHRESMVKLSEQLAVDPTVKKPIALSANAYIKALPAETRINIDGLFLAICLGSKPALDVLFQHVHPTILVSISKNVFQPPSDHFYYGPTKFKDYSEILQAGAQENIPRAMYCFALSSHESSDVAHKQQAVSLLYRALQISDHALATAAVTCLETHLKDKDVERYASYKLFVLHQLGLGPISKDATKALGYWRQGFFNDSPKSGMLELLFNDLTERVAQLNQLAEQNQPMQHALERAWALNVFAQAQNWSKESHEIQNKIGQLNETLINLRFAQTSTGSHSTEETASTSTSTTAATQQNIAEKKQSESQIAQIEILLKKSKEVKIAYPLVAGTNDISALPYEVRQSISSLYKAICDGNQEAWEILFREVHPTILARYALLDHSFQDLDSEEPHEYKFDPGQTFHHVILRAAPQMQKAPMGTYYHAIADYYHLEITVNGSAALSSRHKTIDSLYNAMQLNSDDPRVLAGVTYLENYLKDKKIESYASYKLFVLHYLGLAPVNEDKDKAFTYWRQNFFNRSPKPELLELLAHDLTERVTRLNEAAAQKQPIDHTAWQHVLALHLFALTQDWSQESLDIRNEIYKTNNIIINLRFCKNEIDGETVTNQSKNEVAPPATTAAPAANTTSENPSLLDGHGTTTAVSALLPQPTAANPAMTSTHSVVQGQTAPSMN